MKNILAEFKTFAIKGNVIDLAVAVVIGAAFGKIVTSLVDDIIMPIIGLFGKTDFSKYIIAGQIKIGMFINNIVNFLIVAISIFFAVKFLNRITQKRVEATPQKTDSEMDLQ